MVTQDLSVPYYQQETDYYCGAACAQMVLEEIGAGTLDQDDLYNDNHGHSLIETNWYSGPDGVNWTMNNRKPASFGNFFVLFELASEDAISRKIAWTIHHYQVAPIAMVYGWAHWIVVRGYESDEPPSSSSDTSYALTGLFINNPWPPTGSTSPGIADEHISYATWQGTYMTGVPSGHWAGKFLAVCDPERPAEEMGRQIPEPGKRRANLLTSKAAASAALAGVDRHRLVENKPFARALEGAEPSESYLVQRLDAPDAFYQLVPMQRKGRTSAVISVDARDARYQQTSVTADAKWDLSSLRPEQILKRFVGERLQVTGTEVRVPVRREAVCVYPTLVWRPCRESLSPTFPFAMITVGDYRFFVRADGEVFSQLHTLDRGI
jgi:hypothetical protein